MRKEKETRHGVKFREPHCKSILKLMETSQAAAKFSPKDAAEGYNVILKTLETDDPQCDVITEQRPRPRTLAELFVRVDGGLDLFRRP